MTLEETIKHCEEVAEKNEESIAYYTRQGDKEWLDECEKDCIEFANEHRQLAEWLKRLKRIEDYIADGKDDMECTYSLCFWEIEAVMKGEILGGGVMPNSLRSKIKHLAYKGEFNERERDQLLSALDHEKDVTYICDGKKCPECSKLCNHTTDISHAINFEPGMSIDEKTVLNYGFFIVKCHRFKVNCVRNISCMIT